MFLKNYIFKVFGNFISIILSFILTFFLPNYLGPINFGKFDYLNSFNDNLKLFFDFNTSTSFYIEISKNYKNYKYFKYYILHIFFVFSLLFFFIFLLLNNFLFSAVFADIDYYIVVEALILGYFLWVSEITRKIHDAIGNTNKSELHFILSKIFLCFLFFFLFYHNKISLFNIVLINLLTSFLLVLYQIKALFKFYNKNDLDLILKSDIKEAYTSIYRYSKPLFFSTIIIFISTFYDRYFLLLNNNFEEQAFYGVAFRLSTISFFLIASLTQLLMREFVIIQNNFYQLRNIFNTKLFYLYIFVSIFAIVTCFFSNEIINFVYGSGYYKSINIFFIISLYPLHQLFGQILGAYFLANKLTKLYSHVMIYSFLGGFILSFLLISNSFYFNLGGIGLAIKVILVQFISTNILFFYICKKFKIRFFKKLFLQLFIPLFLFIVLYFSNYYLSNLILVEFSFIYITIIYFLILILIFFLLQKYRILKLLLR